MRDEKLDVLRFVGLAMIILAHISPPHWIFQLRNFDVPLMVMISGVAFGLSYKSESYGAYVWKRVKRLLFPAWIFLTAYFFLMYTISFPAPLPAIEKIVESYLLLKGIGYVWIIRVFLLVALVAPFVLRATMVCEKKSSYFICLAAVYIVYEVALYILKFLPPSIFISILENTLFYVIPYAIIFSFGLRFSTLPLWQHAKAALFFTCIFFAITAGLYAYTGSVVYTQEYKYPPRLYYLSYALSVSFIVWIFVDLMMPYIKRFVAYPIVEFIAQNSLWVYLWHIPFVELFVDMNFYYKYPLVFGCASVMTFLQVYMVSAVIIPKLSSSKIKKNFKILFTG